MVRKIKEIINIKFPAQRNNILLVTRKTILNINIIKPITRKEVLKWCLSDTLSYLSDFDLLSVIISWDKYINEKAKSKLQINI